MIPETQDTEMVSQQELAKLLEPETLLVEPEGMKEEVVLGK